MNLGISGRTALVFGGSGGLGAAIGAALAAEGVRVVLAGRTAETLERAAFTIRQGGYNARALEWELGNLSIIESRVAAVEADIGPIDILVNNTGGPPPAQVSGQDPAVWQRHFETMVLSVMAITDRVLPGMKANRWGRVITSASSGVVAPIPNLGLSNVLRLALVGWSKTLAAEVARDGVTANVVVPGRISTPRIRFLDEARARREGRSVAEVERDSSNSIPVGRYGEPSEYGDVVAFLASDRASYVTGSVIRVDGGFIPSI